MLAALPPGNYIGIDIDRERIDEAKKTLPNALFYVMDVSYGIPDGVERETVIVADVLEHLPFDKAMKVLLRAWELAGTNMIITLPWDDDLAINIDHKWRPNEAYASKICCAIEGQGNTGSVTSERKFGFCLMDFPRLKVSKAT